MVRSARPGWGEPYPASRAAAGSEALDIGEVTVAEGDLVLLGLGAANHDVDAFDDPEHSTSPGPPTRT